MFAILRDNILVDAWKADTIQEAQLDNPDATVIEVTVENGPWEFGKYYDKDEL